VDRCERTTAQGTNDTAEEVTKEEVLNQLGRNRINVIRLGESLVIIESMRISLKLLVAGGVLLRSILTGRQSRAF
jgi:hypothetical protein